jgi:dipeptidyl aminopeptidase/acylaminoacyl peptidase
MLTAAYGSWSSPVTVEMMTSASVGLGTPTVDGADLYWTEARADQGGRTTLFRQAPGREPVELTPEPFYVRSRVHEYGGGEYAARSGVAVFSHFADGRLYLVRGESAPTPLTPEAAHRFGDLRVHPERNLVLAVREDHTGQGEAVNTIVALDLGGPNATGGVVLCEGADFYANPELSADGRLAWTEWDHPAMPWDSTRIRVGRLDHDRVTDVQEVAGGAGESAVQPRWTPGGTLIFLSDRTDWWNLYAWSGGATHPLHPAEAEFANPMWRLGQHPYAVIDDDRLLVTWSTNGAGCVGVLTQSTGELTSLAPVGTSTASVSVGAGSAAAVLSSPERPPRLAQVDLTSGTWRQVRAASDVLLDEALVSLAQPVSWSSGQGPVYGWFYPPTNPGYAAPAGTLPPLITLSHGGPTAYSGAGFSLAVQYWTSRGIAILDVNYGGSTGYGRAYRERLQGTWGLVDVADCAAGAVAMGENGLADPRRLAISGGSAGGYTTLRALTATDVFSAGISLYGVGDLELLAKDTHKFESRYLDGLVGPYPAAMQTYRDRSPVHHVDQLSAPILLLQGADDQVVPPNQAETMAAAARTKGLPVALIVFAGEGHGFRRAENIRASIEAQLAFLGRVFGFAPADELPPIQIENLPHQ